MKTVRKNITLPITAYETINNYAKKCGMSFSEFLRDTALKTIEDLNIDFDDVGGKEITLDEFLQD